MLFKHKHTKFMRQIIKSKNEETFQFIKPPKVDMFYDGFYDAAQATKDYKRNLS